jgi:hypothetical protein
MLERTLPDRFGTQPPPVQTLPAPIPPAVVNVWCELAKFAASPADQVVDVQAVKQLPESSGQQPTGQDQEQQPEPARTRSKLP